MKEEAIARGEHFSDEEYSEEDDDPGNIPNADSGTVLTHVCEFLSNSHGCRLLIIRMFFWRS